MRTRSFVPGHRIERTVAVLRVSVAVLVLVHVALLRDQLEGAGLLGVATGCALAFTASTVGALVVVMRARTLPTYRVAAAVAFLLDTVSLVLLARVTVQVEPQASIAWSFVLWAPFSVAVRSRPLVAMLASVFAAALVAAACRLDTGALAPLPRTWTEVGVPVLLVLVAGAATTFVTLCQSLGGQQVQRRLADEQHRTSRLREADELKNTFLAAVSHELRTPLTSILGFSLTMLDRPDLDDEQRERMLRHVVLEAEHLEDILANLLDLDRLTRGKATLVPMDLDPAQVVEAAVANVRRRSGRDIQLHLARGLWLRLDAAKVERIVENLVGNAVKYTPIDASIVVTLERAERGGVTIRVDDAGPGISRELREKIFEPFRRGADVGVAGTGIGLSLVDRFSRMHGGTAWVEERPGGGCRFQVYLPSLPSTSAPGGASVIQLGDAADDATSSVPSPHDPAVAGQ